MSDGAEERRLLALRVVVALGFVTGLVLCSSLWQGLREYPVAPLLSGLPPFAPEGDGRLLLALLVFLALTPFPRVGTAAALGAAALLTIEVLYDQSRIQPWVTLYAGLMVVSAVARTRSALNAARALVAFTYIWSGIHKMNALFPTVIFAWVAEPVTRIVPVPPALLTALGFATPVLETLIGVGLLFGRLRGAACWGAAGMHLFLLYCLGPFGHDWNSVIWPWNITMIALVLVLFCRTPAVTARAILHPARSRAHALVMAYVLVMPALCRLGLWDRFLSFSVYSGNSPAACLHLPDELLGALPWTARRVARPDGPHRSKVELMDWSMAAVNVPPYPEKRVYEALAHTVRRRARSPQDVVLRIY